MPPGQGTRAAGYDDPLNSTHSTGAMAMENMLVVTLLDKIRAAGGTLPISRGQMRAQDLAALSRATGNEFVIFRDRATGQLFVRELGPAMGQVPQHSRLVIHAQPGEGPLAVQPSLLDRQALRELGQRSSVIINSAGTFSIRFRIANTSDNLITPCGA